MTVFGGLSHFQGVIKWLQRGSFMALVGQAERRAQVFTLAIELP
jgi:hypothetical protein